jgi:formate dehydrogenase iron-sulfur subunit
MYVLQHADRPELYHGLPSDPKISPWVSLWKGITKPLMALGLGIAVLGAFFHYITRGPKEVDDSSHKGG